MPQDSTFQVGDHIGQDGKYEIIQLLGKGGMGAVFRAFDQFLEREVAIKTILLDQDPSATKALRERFLREARSVARVSNHPNIVQIYEVSTDAERPFIAMEFIDGEDVSRLKPRLTIEQTLFICDRVASALDFIHSKGIYHRDVKPGNIMVGRQWEVKLMDFGIAKDSQRTSMTQYSVRLGSPLYMAPETLADEPVASGFSDQYALAVILYELLTQRYPFDAPDFRGLFIAICSNPPKPARAFSPWIPQSVEAVINRGLAKSPKDRFRSCGEMVSEFRRALGDVNALQQAMEARRAEAGVQLSQSHHSLSMLRSFAERYQDWPDRSQVMDRILELEDVERKREARERIAFQTFDVARERKDVTALQKFIERFPDSRYATEARAYVASIEEEQRRHAAEQRQRQEAERKSYEAARASDDLDVIQSFLYDFPDSEHANEIVARAAAVRAENDRRRKERDKRERAAREELRHAIVGRNVPAIRDWLEKYQDIPELASHARQQQKLLEIEEREQLEEEKRQKELDAARVRKAFEDAMLAQDAGSLNALIAAYPGAPEVKGAREVLDKMAQLERQRREAKAREVFAVASSFRDVELLRSFSQQFPEQSELNAKATKLIAEIEREESDRKAREKFLDDARQAFDMADTFRDRGLLREFLRDYAGAPQEAKARQLLAELDDQDRQAAAKKAAEERLHQAHASLDQVRNSGDPAALRKFAAEFADTPYAAEAAARANEIDSRRAAGDAAFEKGTAAVRANSGTAALEQFLAEYPDHAKAAEARKRIAHVREEEKRRQDQEIRAEAQAWSKVLPSDEPADVEDFLAKYPNGAHVNEARRRLADLRELRRSVLESSDAGALTRFLAAYPKSPDRPSAQARLNQLETQAWEKLNRSDQNQIQNFLTNFGTGSFASAATQALDHIRREEEAYSGLTDGDPAPFEKFLSDFPDSPRTGEVRSRLSDIRTRQAAAAAAATPKPAPPPPPPPRSTVQPLQQQPQFSATMASTPQVTQQPQQQPQIARPLQPAPPPQPPPVEPPAPKKPLPVGAIAAGIVGLIAIGGGIWWSTRGAGPGKETEKGGGGKIEETTRPEVKTVDVNAGDDAAWKQAVASPDPAASRDYVRKFPNGRHVAEANRRIETLTSTAKAAFDTAQNSADPNLLEAFATTYPWSDQAKTAKSKASDLRSKEDQRFKEVSASPTGDKVSAFAREFPWSKRISDLRGKGGEEDFWKSVASSRNPKDFDDFRQRYPSSSHSAEAKSRADQMRSAESAAWNQIAKSDRAADFDKFRTDFPWSDHLQQAEKSAAALREEDTAWQSVTRSNPKDLEQFRLKYPNGRYAREASRLEQELTARANREWDNVRAKNDPKAIEQFIKDFPYSDKLNDARARIDQIRKAEEAARLKDEQDKKEKAAREAAEKEKAAAAAKAAEGKGTEVAKTEGGGTKPPPPPGGDIQGKDGIVYKLIPGKGFHIAQTETTIGAFDLYLQATGAKPRGGKAQLPVSKITAAEAEGYCRWVGGRLPTKAEWEYAAHGGKNSQFPNGDEISKSQAHYRGNNPSPVKSYPPNGYGLFDMAGNLSELVQGGIVKGGDFLTTKDADLAISQDFAFARGERNGFRCVIP